MRELRYSVAASLDGYIAGLNGEFDWIVVDPESAARRRAVTTIASMAGRECYHCKSWIDEGDTHDCWTTTEAALTRDLPEDLQDAWKRLRETAAGLGEQRIYASHKSIMFARKTCYFFVRPRKNVLELCVFLGRALKAPQVRRVVRASTTKLGHIIHIKHRDEVEAPVTDWIREAYELPDVLATQRSAGRAASPRRVRKSLTPGKRTQLP